MKDLLLALGILFFSIFKTSLYRFFLEAEKEIHAVIPLTEQATEVYRQICLNGLNRKGVSVTFKISY